MSHYYYCCPKCFCGKHKSTVYVWSNHDHPPQCMVFASHTEKICEFKKPHYVHFMTRCIFSAWIWCFSLSSHQSWPAANKPFVCFLINYKKYSLAQQTYIGKQYRLHIWVCVVVAIPKHRWRSTESCACWGNWNRRNFNICTVYLV